MASPAFAEDQTQPAGNTDIIVTAQFQAQSLQDTPLAITAQTGEMLAARGIDTTKELVAIAPSVNLTSNAAVFGASTSVFIRGVGQYDNNFAYEPGVGIYLDDIYYGVITGADFELADIDRVEILRGPQGTLSGKNSEGGSIKIYGKKPVGDGSGYVEATYGSRNRIDVRGALDVSLLKDIAALRVSGFTSNQDGYMKRIDFACANPSLAGNIPVGNVGTDCQIGTEGGTQRWGVRAALRITPSDNVEINIIGDRTIDKSDPAALKLAYAFAPFGAPTYNGDPAGTPWDSRFVTDKKYVTYATYDDTTNGFDAGARTLNKAWGISGDVSVDVSDSINLRSITGYRALNTLAGFDQDGSPIGVSTTQIHNTYHQFTQELRLSGKSDLLDWTVGGFYYDAHGVLMNSIDAPPTQFITHDPVDTTSKSGFAHVVLHPAEGLDLIAGIRYTDDEKVYNFNRTNLQGGPPNPAQAPLNALPSLSYSGDHVDYRLGVNYRFNDQVMAYAQWSTGYKGGGVNAKPFSPNQATSFGPESLDTWELGLKTDFADNRVRLNFAGFYSKYHDIVLVNAAGYCVGNENPGNSDCLLSAQPFNAGSAKMKGLEVEANLEPVDGLTINGSLSYLDFQYTELAPAALASYINIDDYPPLTPKWKLSGGIAYRFQMKNGATITPRVDVDYTSKTYSDPANNGFYPDPNIFPQDPQFAGLNPYLIPGHTTVNARIAFVSADKNWEASLSVKNLTNLYYWTNAFAFYFTGTGQYVMAPPREWAVSIKRSF
ncbi:MAG: TonB-dependent receptor [Candidatus Andeanibacterium colombiense]|uniref:TonB-dependent receptor n=1 Tax=Candidatus Andeanibacterium colombiense TaxID=3121345 RepID=A0AAJ6BPC6_9SPHN|nr:MAG: TonB-dependent receptor [Sphingomonadaceae bacterium]